VKRPQGILFVVATLLVAGCCDADRQTAYEAGFEAGQEQVANCLKNAADLYPRASYQFLRDRCIAD
jgi:hypothetical protein